jgi:hypothetical protein
MANAPTSANGTNSLFEIPFAISLEDLGKVNFTTTTKQLMVAGGLKVDLNEYTDHRPPLD